MQVVGYETERDDRRPALRVADTGRVTREPLEAGRNLAYSLGKRHCAGVTDETGHRACDEGDTPYCDAHTSTWVCARCTGTCLKDEMDCYDDHAIYLAAFAPATFKVGVTRAWRLRTRLREQGADRAAHLRTVSNGRIAREIEARIAREYTDRVRVPDKIAGLHRSVDESAWSDTLAAFDHEETFDFDYGFELKSGAVPETVVTGEVVGVQGRVFVLERGGTTYAVDLRDLVGYEVRAEASDRELQSSLGAF
ncbi:DUF2797 domain-containing protein [Halorussus amylolyticus]|uniref:DUF2797 domain-containing protein n=1 Tax=Halorussus amylolyticus TaxID=1126242 RepID=UPI001EE48705|nr:DUF2797 domain-containing protein [Halorussus amylolyticus]